MNMIHPQTMIQIDSQPIERPTAAEAEEAVRTLLRWAGDDPDREGLTDTPGRVVRAYRQWFRGYEEDPVAMLQRTFEEVEGYDEMVVLRDIRFESYCEHQAALDATVFRPDRDADELVLELEAGELRIRRAL